MKLVLSPTPPVECLSTFTPAMCERSTVSPGMLLRFVTSREMAPWADSTPPTLVNAGRWAWAWPTNEELRLAGRFDSRLPT